MNLVDRLPRCHVIAHRADGKDRQADITRHDRAAIDQIAPLGEIVIEIKPAQILAVHPCGHACRIRVPRHQVEQALPFAQQIFLHLPRPDQILRVQQLERPGHLPAVQIALVGHDRIKERQLAFTDKERQLARFAKIDLGGQQAHAVQTGVAIARHRRRGDGQQGAAKAIADCIHLLIRHDCRYRIQRRHDAKPAVVLQPLVAILRAGVLPRDHENRMALPDQPAHHGIMRREVEDVIFHDPGRHDQHRRGMNLRRRRRILDQFDQAVAIDHLAGADAHILADDEILAAGRWRLGQRAAQVIQPVLRALAQIGAAGFHGLLQDLWIGPEEVAGRPHVQPLPAGESHQILVMARNAAQAGGGVLPPVLLQQKALMDDVEGPFLPGFVHETAILLQRLDAVGAAGIRRRLPCVIQEPALRIPCLMQ